MFQGDVLEELFCGVCVGVYQFFVFDIEDVFGYGWDIIVFFDIF